MSAVYNLESFTNEERQRVEDVINQIKCERENRKKYLEKALTELGNLIDDIYAIRHKLECDGYIENDELVKCFKEINESRVNGALKVVIK
jgi:hypothetical protein